MHKTSKTLSSPFVVVKFDEFEFAAPAVPKPLPPSSEATGSSAYPEPDLDMEDELPPLSDIAPTMQAASLCLAYHDEIPSEPGTL